MRIVLISTYDLGRQPFGLASPAAWLRRAGFRVRCNDLAVDVLDEAAIAEADLVAFHVPMHTATRIAASTSERVREIKPGAHLCFYGLYAPTNERWLRQIGAGTVLGGEFEPGLVDLARRLARRPSDPEAPRPSSVTSLERLRFEVPDREDLPALERYAGLRMPDGTTRRVGYTEASRGCKHRCRHCPVVPVYGGVFRIVQREAVLADVRQQVESGARHITLGDPDFFNGIRHAMALVEALHAEHPGVTYDVTIKIEHLVRHAAHLPRLGATGCLLVTSAVESIDDGVLARLDKGHRREDFVRAVLLCRESGLLLNPTFVAFHPWTTLEGYLELLRTVEELDLVPHVAPIQLALRLLVPAGSRLLELEELQGILGPFDERALLHPWSHPDPAVDDLQKSVLRLVAQEARRGRDDRFALFAAIRDLALEAVGRPGPGPTVDSAGWSRRAWVPYLTEPWYC